MRSKRKRLRKIRKKNRHSSSPRLGSNSYRRFLTPDKALYQHATALGGI